MFATRNVFPIRLQSDFRDILDKCLPRQKKMKTEKAKGEYKNFP